MFVKYIPLKVTSIIKRDISEFYRVGYMYSKVELFSNRQAASLPGFIKLDMLGFRIFHKEESIKNVECM